MIPNYANLIFEKNTMVLLFSCSISNINNDKMGSFCEVNKFVKLASRLPHWMADAFNLGHPSSSTDFTMLPLIIDQMILSKYSSCDDDLHKWDSYCELLSLLYSSCDDDL